MLPVPGPPAAPGAGTRTKLRLQFGGFEFDSESRQLRGPEGVVHLSPKAFELLAALLESRPRALSKAELHDRVWAGTFVSDSNLASLVKEIRKALGDPVCRPAFLRTVHGFGYSFCGEAAEATPRPGPASNGVDFFLIWGPRELLLDDGENLIGRSLGASARVQSATVSRWHARIVLAADGATIEDLGSKNGTYLNGRRLSGPATVVNGDAISLGSVRLVFRAVSATDSTQTFAEPPGDS